MWCSILTDDKILQLSPADRWRFVALGAYIKEHGTNGIIEIHPQNPALAMIFGVEPTEVLNVLKHLPNVHIDVQLRRGNCDNDTITVTFRNWYKYQVDATVYERVKRLRYKRRGEERREEESRKEIKDGGQKQERAALQAQISKFIAKLMQKLQKNVGKLTKEQIKQVQSLTLPHCFKSPTGMAGFSEEIDRLATAFDGGGKPSFEWYLSAIRAVINRREHETLKQQPVEKPVENSDRLAELTKGINKNVAP